MGRRACGSGKSRETGRGSGWDSMTFQVGHRTRSLWHKPSAFSVGSRPPTVLGSEAEGTLSWVNSSRAWKSVTLSACCKQESAILHLSGSTIADPVRIQPFKGIIPHSVIHGSREVCLGVIRQKIQTESYSLDVHAWGVRSGGSCCRFLISFSSAGPCHLTLQMEVINSTSHLLLSLHLFE